MACGEPALKASPNEATERLLIEAAQRDPRRFADLYEDNFERVYAYIARRVRDRDQAQDLTADVFHQALANIKRYEWRGLPFVAWLIRIASNAITDHARHSRKEVPADDHHFEIADAKPHGSNLEEIESRARLFKLVDRLPAAQRRVVVM